MNAAADRVRVLIVGAGGLLGHRLVHEFCQGGRLSSAAVNRPRRADVEIALLVHLTSLPGQPARSARL
jgi:uncharacterized protein YbjT (DUF2867 family)